QKLACYRTLTSAMAYHCVEDRRVSAEPFRIHVCPRVDVGAMRQQHFENFFLIEIDRQMQKRCSIDRRPMHSRAAVLCATEFRRINLEQAEPTLNQSRITAEEILKPG